MISMTKFKTAPRGMWSALFLVFFLGTFSLPGFAQRDLPPEKGGETYSLGMPPVYKGRSGFELQWYRPQNNSELAGFYNLGLSKDLGSPVVGIAALRLEGYVGFRNQDLDGGGIRNRHRGHRFLGCGNGIRLSGYLLLVLGKAWQNKESQY